MIDDLGLVNNQSKFETQFYLERPYLFFNSWTCPRANRNAYLAMNASAVLKEPNPIHGFIQPFDRSVILLTWLFKIQYQS